MKTYKVLMKVSCAVVIFLLSLSFPSVISKEWLHWMVSVVSLSFNFTWIETLGGATRSLECRRRLCFSLASLLWDSVCLGNGRASLYLLIWIEHSLFSFSLSCVYAFAHMSAGTLGNQRIPWGWSFRLFVRHPVWDLGTEHGFFSRVAGGTLPPGSQYQF